MIFNYLYIYYINFNFYIIKITLTVKYFNYKLKKYLTGNNYNLLSQLNIFIKYIY